MLGSRHLLGYQTLQQVFRVMTASQQAKAQGFKSLAQVSELSGVSARTLINWHKDKQYLFQIVLLGLATQEKLNNE